MSLLSQVSQAEIDSHLSEHPEWQIEGGELVRTFKFSTFSEAVTFVNRVATLAEEAGHHPDIDIRYNRVRFALVSHDAGGITGKDLALAAGVDRLSAGFAAL
jgi:4a-hydroxytetrahydrobiopterin dehydratase